MTMANNEDAVELRRDALVMVLTVAFAGWTAFLVGCLVAREITGVGVSPWPLGCVFVALLAATICRAKGWLAVASWLVVGGLLVGPALFVQFQGFSQAALFLFLLPIVVSHLLLPAVATWICSLGAVTLMALLATVGQPFASLSILVEALGLIALPSVICLLVATVLFLNALNSGALIAWALDSQRKDARRAELFRQQEAQLRQAFHEIERANFQLHMLNGDLAEARRVAEVANQLKTRFLANVSHELRTPLHVILGLTEGALATANTPAPNLARDLQHIQHSGQHLQRLINDLLDLSRAEINALELYPETIDAHDVLADLFESVADSQESPSPTEWRLDLPEQLPLVQADPVRLRQILFNLLSNAAKFTRNGRITLGATVEPPFLHVWVADTGSGIAVDQQERIFEPFATDPKQGRPNGVGLGLSITRRLVALHNGSLTLESQPNVGSTFHVYLPLPDLHGKPAHPPATAHPVLLLFSTEPEPTASIRTIAERQGLPLRRPRSLEALRLLLHDEWPASVIWDLEHAATEDWPMIQYIRSNPALCSVPLLVFGASNGAIPDLAQGVTEFLIKPLGEGTLTQNIRALGPVGAGPVLIVDDDPHARAGYRALIERSFPEQAIIEAEDGQIALAALARERPSLIILDLMMPEVDGFAVLEEVRANPATHTTPVLVLSGRMLTLDDVKRLEYAHVTLQTKSALDSHELIRLAERVANNVDELPPATSAVVKHAIAYIHQHYDHTFSRGDIAAAVGVSERYLTEIFHQETGLSVWEYLNRLRIVQAKTLLHTTTASIGEIGAQVGFENAHYFTRMFRRIVGASPSAYRQGHTTVAAES